MRCQLYLALDRQYVTEPQFAEAYDPADKTSRQLHRFIQYLEASKR